MQEQQYDNLINEGGEGYNPHRANRERQEWEAAQAEAKAYALTPQGQIEALQRRIELECGSVAREWGNSEAIDALRKELRAEIKTIEDELDAEFLAAWTPEITAGRRAAWNARVKAGEFGKPGSGRVDFSALAKAEQSQGWTLDDLKRAIKLHV